ncbi:MAG TPA: cardiolipin synthase ClsB [Gallionellaceae bacterium]
MSEAIQVGVHSVRLLCRGEEYFPRLVKAVNAAVRSIYLETYIYESDASGRQVMDALVQAAQRGVSVHLLLDGFGAQSLTRDWVREMRDAGVQVLYFRPQISWLTLKRQRLRRLHRKQALIDGRIAFVGGINIVDDNSDDVHMPPRLDYAVEIEGEVVQRIHVAMRRLWLLVMWSNFRIRREREKLRLRFPVQQHHEVAFVFRDNLHHRYDIEYAYLKAIASARHEIIIANAYFLPGRRFRHVLLHAARRGVRVVLMLQGHTDHPLMRYATRALYEELMSAGVEIHEYHNTFMHAKVAVVDGHWATVGSSNIDPFSLWLAREGNIVVRDDKFAAVLRDSLMQEMEHGARLIRHSAWLQKIFLARLLPRLSYMIVRLIIGIVGYAHEQDRV